MFQRDFRKLTKDFSTEFPIMSAKKFIAVAKIVKYQQTKY